MKRDTRLLVWMLGMVAAVVCFMAVGSFIADARSSPTETSAQARVETAPVAKVLREAVDDSRQAIAEPVREAQASMATAAVPALVAAAEGLASSLPAKPLAAPLRTWAVSPAAVDMIVSFEIISPAYYTKRLQRPIWPGAASGVTWGIGYDGGHQTRQRIARDWDAHPDVDELATTSGITGQRARAALPAYRHIVTPLDLAQQVFAEATLPKYAALAERTFHDGWECLTADARGSLTATVQNRGASMRGARRAEMRVLQDECVPNCDTSCMAAQYRSMCRIWRGTDVGAGLCRRYEMTARLAEGALS